MRSVKTCKWYFHLFTPYSYRFRLRRYSKHSRQCSIIFPNTSKCVKNSPRRVVFLTFFLAFGNAMKRSLLCLIYYLILPSIKYWKSLSILYIYVYIIIERVFLSLDMSKLQSSIKFANRRRGFCSKFGHHSVSILFFFLLEMKGLQAETN